MVAPSTAAETNRVRNHFYRNFKGRMPAFGVMRDSADNMKTIDALLQRFESDPRLGGTGSLESILAANPELGADIGKALEAKVAVERHERHFDKDLKFEKAMENWKTTADKSLTEMLWKAPANYLTNVVKKGFHAKGLGDFVGGFFGETAKFTGREAWAGSKFLAQSAYTAGSFVKNKVFR